MLGTDAACQTMKFVDRAFKSFFALIAKARSGSYQFNQIHLPHYLDRDGYFSLIFPTTHIVFKDGWFYMPMSRIFQKEHERIKLRVPLDKSKFLGIDLGLDNLATCVSSDGASFIIDGKQLKSYNRLYNKENARLQSEKDRQEIKGVTRRQVFNVRKRNRRVNYAMSVAAAQQSRTVRFARS